jgi:hypothetical protein
VGQRPDCPLLRTETRLTLAEAEPGHYRCPDRRLTLPSDHLSALPPDRLRLVNACCIYRPAPHVLDWFDQPTPQHLQLDLDGSASAWHLIALFNWKTHRRNNFEPDEFTRPQLLRA